MMRMNDGTMLELDDFIRRHRTECVYPSGGGTDRVGRMAGSTDLSIASRTVPLGNG